MKIEIDSDAAPAVMVCTLILALLVLGVCAMLANCYMVRMYTARGYTRTTLTGANDVYWVKETK